jgi:hypothetical protein
VAWVTLSKILRGKRPLTKRIVKLLKLRGLRPRPELLSITPVPFANGLAAGTPGFRVDM